MLDLIKRESIWVNVNSFNYLVFSSKKKILELFGMECAEGRWRFVGEGVRVWGEGVRSRQRYLVRFNNHDVYLCEGSSLIKCFVENKGIF